MVKNSLFMKFFERSVLELTYLGGHVAYGPENAHRHGFESLCFGSRIANPLPGGQVD
jgi:hypothetical protein